LRASSEEISEGRFSFVGLESIFLVDPHPRQFLPPPRQLIAPPRQFFLNLEQLQPGRKPLLMCSSLMVGHRVRPFSILTINQSVRASPCCLAMETILAGRT